MGRNAHSLTLTQPHTDNADNADNVDNTGNADNTDNADNPWRINHLIQDNYSTLLPPAKAWSTPHHLINSQAISLPPPGVSSVLCLKKPRRELKSMYPTTGATTIFQSSLEALLLLRQSPPQAGVSVSEKPQRELKSMYPTTGATTNYQSSLGALLLLRQSPRLSCTKNRAGGKRSSFLPTFVFRPLTPPHVRFRIRRFYILRAV